MSFFKTGSIYKKWLRIALKGGGGLFLFIGLAGCEPDPLELKEIPVVEPEMVVASQMISDQSVLVLLTRTFGVLEDAKNADPEDLLSQIAVNDARVTISGPDGTDTLQFQENGIYLGLELSLEAGATYELTVESETFGRVSATSTVQQHVPFEELEADLYHVGLEDTLVQLNFSFLDPAGSNFYMLNAQKVGQKDLARQAINPEAYSLLFEDVAFKSPLQQGSFEFFPSGFFPGDTILVSLSNISEEYYGFMKLRMENRLSLFEFLSEPANYPSNVVGGKGYFNLYIPDVRPMVLEP